MSQIATSVFNNAIPCAGCGRLLTNLRVRTMTSDIVCTCGESLVIGNAMFATPRKPTPDFRREQIAYSFA